MTPWQIMSQGEDKAFITQSDLSRLQVESLQYHSVWSSLIPSEPLRAKDDSLQMHAKEHCWQSTHSQLKAWWTWDCSHLTADKVNTADMKHCKHGQLQTVVGMCAKVRNQACVRQSVAVMFTTIGYRNFYDSQLHSSQLQSFARQPAAEICMTVNHRHLFDSHLQAFVRQYSDTGNVFQAFWSRKQHSHS